MYLILQKGASYGDRLIRTGQTVNGNFFLKAVNFILGSSICIKLNKNCIKLNKNLPAIQIFAVCSLAPFISLFRDVQGPGLTHVTKIFAGR